MENKPSSANTQRPDSAWSTPVAVFPELFVGGSLVWRPVAHLPDLEALLAFARRAINECLTPEEVQTIARLRANEESRSIVGALVSGSEALASNPKKARL